MATKTETIAIKVTQEEKNLIGLLAQQNNTTVSRLLYKMVFEDNTGVAAVMKKELKQYTNNDLDEVDDRAIEEAYKVLFKGGF